MGSRTDEIQTCDVANAYIHELSVNRVLNIMFILSIHEDT